MRFLGVMHAFLFCGRLNAALGARLGLDVEHEVEINLWRAHDQSLRADLLQGGELRVSLRRGSREWDELLRCSKEFQASVALQGRSSEDEDDSRS